MFETKVLFALYTCLLLSQCMLQFKFQNKCKNIHENYRKKGPMNTVQCRKVYSTGTQHAYRMKQTIEIV